jgi:hypothetical protein
MRDERWKRTRCIFVEPAFNGFHDALFYLGKCLHILRRYRRIVDKGRPGRITLKEFIAVLPRPVA